MGVKLYNLDTRTWVNSNPVANGSAAANQLLLTNMLIEMRVQTLYHEATNKGVVLTDDVQAMREDVSQDWPING